MSNKVLVSPGSNKERRFLKSSRRSKSWSSFVSRCNLCACLTTC